MRNVMAILSVGVALLALPSPASPQVVTAAQVNGTWRDRTKIFKVWALGNQRLKIEFQGTYEYKARGGWTANTGEASGTANIEGIIATFRPDGADEGCKIIMTFKGERLVVDQKDGCGFGLNVVASGTYRKTSSRKPDFDN
jgi:hypothetical protein